MNFPKKKMQLHLCTRLCTSLFGHIQTILDKALENLGKSTSRLVSRWVPNTLIAIKLVMEYRGYSTIYISNVRVSQKIQAI